MASDRQHYDECPKCGCDAHIRFCGECGTSLVIGEEKAPTGPKVFSVLVAEDSEPIRVAISTLLKMRGFSVIIATNGEEAVSLAGTMNPDLVLMDIQMPDLSGLGALKRIRQDIRTKSTPVIMLTSLTSLRSVTEAMSAGATDYVAKPFTIRKLIGRIEKYTTEAAATSLCNDF